MKIKKLIFYILLTFVCIESASSEIKDSLFITVGNKPITKSDVVDEIKIILILNNESYSEANKDQLHNTAVNTIIKRTIKQIEIEKNSFLKISQEDLERELIQLASKINIDLDTLKNICESNELDFSLVENQVRTELFWNSLIFEIYKNRLKVNTNEVDEKIKLIENKKELNEYLISEILIKQIDKNNLSLEVEELRNKIKLEGFENVAKSISISESASSGGDLGWLNENIISKKLKSTIEKTAVGTLSEPILFDQGILIFKIRDKRKIKNIQSLEETKNQIVTSEKLKILNMHSLSHYDKVRRSVSVKYFQ